MKESNGNNHNIVIQCCFCNKPVNIHATTIYFDHMVPKCASVGNPNLTGVHSYFEETSVFLHDRVPGQQVSVNKSAIENGVEKFGITEEKGMEIIIG